VKIKVKINESSNEFYYHKSRFKYLNFNHKPNSLNHMVYIIWMVSFIC